MRRITVSTLTLAVLAGSAFATDTQVALNYNFNGMVHPGESNIPDSLAPSGFRAIADRGLAIDGVSSPTTTAFGFNPIVGATGITYEIERDAFQLDIVMLGNRNLNAAWDLAPDGDNRGVMPDWLPNDDLRGPQTTTLAAPIALDAYAEVGVLYHISNVGGNTASSTFTVTLNFNDADPVTVTVSGRDWFGSRPALAPAANSGISSQTQLGVYRGANNTDIGAISGDAGQALNVWEAVIDVRKLLLAGLGDYNGKHLTSITFQYPTVVPPGNRNYAIFAATVRTDSSPAVNGTCETAIPLTPGTITGNNNRAPSSAPSQCGSSDDAGVWYTYTATTNNVLQVRTCGSAIDTTLSVFDGCSGTLVGCSDNACGTGGLVQWTGIPGHVYKIRVAGNNNANGNFTLSFDDPVPAYQPVALNYNFNGIVHGFVEQGPDNVNNPNGYRSIADRGIIMESGEVDSIDATPLIDVDGMPFSLVTEAGELDIVHLGDRNLVANQARVYGSGGNNATQPAWQPDSDQTGPQTTDLSSAGYTLTANSRLGIIYHITDSGGTFDTTLNFTDSSSVTVNLRAPDWFNSQVVPAPGANSGLVHQRQLGVYAATDGTDFATISTNNLNLVEAVTSVAELAADGFGNHAGKQISSLVFSNPLSNANYPNSTPQTSAGFAIFAA
ncbi:MAG TPA: hypothetical protein VEB22_11970, partial [Phycisphaerales bacterium]|nr:hypothetical protein [Phycisphaerales bacterium]